MRARKLPEKITCERVFLKRHDLKDAPIIFQSIHNDRKRLSRFLSFVAKTKTERDSLNYIRKSREKWNLREGFEYGIYLRESREFVGSIGVQVISWAHESCELGYWITQNFEGQGLMTEAATYLSRKCFEIGFHRVQIRCASDNYRSMTIPMRCGFRLEGWLRAQSKLHSKYQDILVFGRLKGDQPILKPTSTAG